MSQAKGSEIERDWFEKNRIRGILRGLEAENRKLMLEVENLLKDYLVAMLDLTHRRLIGGKISLSQYYRDTQMLACCAERLRNEDD